MPIDVLDYMCEAAKVLSAAGVATPRTNLLIDSQPDRIGPAASTGPEIFLLTEQGAPPGFVYGHSTATFRRPRWRVNVRSTEPAGEAIAYSSRAMIKASAAHDAFAAVCNQSIASTISGTTGWWLRMMPDSEPFMAGRDSRDRAVYTFTVTGERQTL